MTNVTQILKNIFANYFGLLLGIIVTFFLTPFIIRSIGKSYYGIWMIINSLIGYMGILDFGIRPAVNRFVAKHIGLKEVKGINQVVVSSFTALCASAVLLMIVTGILIVCFHSVFNIESMDPVVVRWTLAIVGLSFALGMPMQVFGGLLSGSERYDLQNLSAVTALILRTLLIVYLLSKGYNLVALAVATAVTGLLQYFIDWRLALRIHPELDLSLGYFDFKVLREIVTYGLFSIIINVSLLITYYTDLTVIGIFATASAAAVYSIPGSLITYTRTLTGQISRVFTPTMTKSFFSSGLEELQELYLNATHYVSAVSMGLVAGVAIFGGDFIRLWVGSEFSSGYPVLLILLIPQVFGLSQQMSAQVMFGIGKINLMAYLELGSALSNLILSVVLIQYWGLAGVALGTAIPLFVTHTFLLPPIVCHEINLPVKRYLLRGYLRSIVLSGGFALFLFGLRYILTPASWAIFTSIVGLSVIIYGTGCWFFILDGETRGRISRRLMSIWERGSRSLTVLF